MTYVITLECRFVGIPQATPAPICDVPFSTWASVFASAIWKPTDLSMPGTLTGGACSDRSGARNAVRQSAGPDERPAPPGPLAPLPPCPLRSFSLNILFLCTGNSARSILAEALLNSATAARGRFRAFSAGSHPRGTVHPLAIEMLHERGIPVDGLRSKSWDEFAAPHAPPIDIVITVCDAAAAETCPVWPGRPVSAHWGMADPSARHGSAAEQRAAFEQAADILQRRIDRLLALPIETLTPEALAKALREIGE